ncbi:hypothetical protein ACQKNB_23620 [Lysinibacillus xylanilyticus]|uniref:hypothetical protein n=1 Tax=Lysinibacillus xylanilyticus TaxID=582475 RepID=UPI003CFE79F1
MKKTFILMLLLLVGSVFITACSKSNSNDSKSYFYQTDIEETNTYFNDNEKGFVLLVTDNDAHFVPTVEKIANDKKVKVIMYNPYQSDGKKNNEGASIFPESKDTEGDAMYYLEDNEIKGELPINSYTDSQLTKEVINFIDTHK